MNADEIKKYCLEKHGAYETQPFGDVPICYKLNNKSPLRNKKSIEITAFSDKICYNNCTGIM